MKQNTDERRRKIDEMRERFAPLRDYMAQPRYIKTNPIVGITEADAQKAIEMLQESVSERRKKAREEIINSETAKRLRQAFQEMRAQSVGKMHKRHAFLSDIVKEYTNLEDFTRDKSEFFEMMGVEVSCGESCVSLYFQLDYDEYEQYFVVPTNDGKLAVSHVIEWQNEACANETLNISRARPTTMMM